MPRPPRTLERQLEPELIHPIHDFTPDPDLDGYYCTCQLPRHNRHHHDSFLGPAPRFPHTPARLDPPHPF
jgi:hypothetical protein